MDLFDEVEEYLGALVFAKAFRSKEVFGSTNGREELLFGFLLQLEHAEVALDQVNQEICQGDQVITAAHRLKVHGIDAAHRDVAKEMLNAFHLNVVSVVIYVSGAQAEVNEADIAEGVRRTIHVTDENVVKLQVIVDITYVVQLLELVKEPDTQLANCPEGESTATLQQVVLQGVAKLLHRDVRVRDGSILIDVMRDRLHIVLVYDSELAACINLWIVLHICGSALELVKNLIFSLALGQVFGDLDDDATAAILGVGGAIELAIAPMGKVLVCDISLAKKQVHEGVPLLLGIEGRVLDTGQLCLHLRLGRLGLLEIINNN